MSIKITIVYGDPPDYKDRVFIIENNYDRGYFFKWLWKVVCSEQKFGVFPSVLKEMSDELDS